jgi:hypothetical protein
MKNNVNPLDEECIEKARVKALRAYARSSSGWRGVGDQYGISHTYIYSMVMYGIVPRNPDIRVMIKLPRKLPSETARSR